MRLKLSFLTCLHIFLLLATICALFSMFHESYAAVINVPQDYPTIQQAIDAASAGDTIQVGRRSGESQSIYYEKLRVNKQLTLVGESRETIIVDGGETGTVIRIQADNVQIRRFTIRNAGQTYTGIRANSYSYVTIANNTIKTNKYGIVLLNSHYNTVVQNLLFNNGVAGISLSQSIGNNVSDNNVSESAYGIELSSTNATFVVSNTVAHNSYGIYLEHSSNDTVDKNTLLMNHVDAIFPNACYDIIVSNNEVSESAYGIQLYNSDTITVLGNNLTDNSYGVYLAYSGPSNTIENNTISRNDWGVMLYGSSSNTFTGNTLSYNTFGVDPDEESHNNLIHHNNFVENNEQAVWNPDCLNTWDDGYPSGGNYWSDYTGTDSNGDGIGDTAYSIDPMNVDRYPLMREWGGIRDIAIVNITLSATGAASGETVYINVTARNEGTWAETFHVTTYYNITAVEWTAIENQTVANLARGTNRTLTFGWNTTNIPLGIYQIKAEASVMSGETDTADNLYVDGTVTISPVLPDVAILSVSPEVTLIYQGFILEIYVEVKNEGNAVETFSISAYGNSTLIGNQTVTDLQPDTTIILIFNWDTTDVPLGNYTLSATAEIVPGETDEDDNSFVDGVVKVKYPGDVNEDGIVNLDDVHIVAVAIGTTPGMTKWDPRADLAPPYGFIDLVDIFVVISHFGETY